MIKGNYLPLSWLTYRGRYIYLIATSLALLSVKTEVANADTRVISECHPGIDFSHTEKSDERQDKKISSLRKALDKTKACNSQTFETKDSLITKNKLSLASYKEKNIKANIQGIKNLTFANAGTANVNKAITSIGGESSFNIRDVRIISNLNIPQLDNAKSINTNPEQFSHPHKLPFNLQDIISSQSESEQLSVQPQSVRPQLPPPETLLNSPELNESTIKNLSGDIVVKEFEVEGSTVFSKEEILEVLKPFQDRKISFSELIQARSAITKLYVDRGYITSGALIPPQTIADGTIKIKVVEGGLESINVSGLKRLNSSYVRSRVALASKKPVNVPRLLESLRVLQSDPLIKNLSAELMSGSRPGSNILDITLKENRTFGSSFTIDNGRSPSVGSFRRRAQLQQANLLGFGDGLSLGYTNTDGSNGIDATYSLPINSRNGKIEFSFGSTSSKVIEQPFNSLDIISNSRYYELTLRQPLYQSSSEEFNLGLTASRRESKASFLEDEQPFPSIGADEDGRTRISALRFFQEWTKRSSTQVIAARSQFNVGFNAFNATINNGAPDSRFLSWRGQGQWVRLLAPDTLLFVRGDVQLADNTLVPTEQFGNGGFGSVRGYRQDLLLTDNGALLSAELRLPVFKKSQSLLQVVPFVDFGTSWNSGSSDEPKNSTLAAVGLGLQFSQGNSLSARLDWGIPLISVDSDGGSLQENGLYFSITTKPF